MEPGTAEVPSRQAGIFPEDLSIFQGPLFLDMGCGNGVFLSALAAREPAANCLGIEKKDYRVRQAQRRLVDRPNARILHGEILEVLRELPADSVARAYLLFSDPWPKRRHAVRRLVQSDFIVLLAGRLCPDGAFFFASDSRSYFEWSCRAFGNAGWIVGEWVVPDDWPRTEFEQRFVSAGLNVWRFQATRKVMHE